MLPSLNLEKEHKAWGKGRRAVLKETITVAWQTKLPIMVNTADQQHQCINETGTRVFPICTLQQTTIWRLIHPAWRELFATCFSFTFLNRKCQPNCQPNYLTAYPKPTDGVTLYGIPMIGHTKNSIFSCSGQRWLDKFQLAPCSSLKWLTFSIILKIQVSLLHSNLALEKLK